MGVDQTGQDQPARRIDGLVDAAGRQIGADRGNRVALDQNVGPGRCVDVAIMVLDVAASNKHALCFHSSRVPLPGADAVGAKTLTEPHFMRSVASGILPIFLPTNGMGRFVVDVHPGACFVCRTGLWR